MIPRRTPLAGLIVGLAIGAWGDLATLPVIASSVLIRPPTVSVTTAGASVEVPPVSPTPVLVPIASEVKRCAARTAGRSSARRFIQ